MRTPPFVPHPLVRGGQLQTMAGQLLAAPALPERTEELLVELADGDRLLLHVNAPQAETGAKPLVLLLHGLGGCSESTYVLRLTHKLTAAGYTVVRFNHRGCGRGADGLARGIYHAGRTGDLAETLGALARRWPERRAVVAAFSLSGNLLLRYLGDRGRETAPLLERALAVCPPVDLEACSLALSERTNFHIDLYYTRALVRTALEKGRTEAQAPAFPRGINLRLFDELYTAPRAGYANRDEYYARSSSKPVLARIALPTTVLAAADDPIIPPQSFVGAQWSSTTKFRLEESGGHMGFIARERTRFGDRRWMDQAVVDWVEGR